MRSFVIVVAVAAALTAVGCGDSERLQNELATANTQIGGLNSTLAEAQTELTGTRQRADSLARALRTSLAAVDSLSASAGRLNNRLLATRTRCDNSLDSLRGVLQTAETQIAGLTTRLQDAETQIAGLEQRAEGIGSERDDLRLERDSLLTFVDGVRPWYDYYRQEARRNWLKKLFGAGDGARPGSSEPSFEVTPPAVDLEAQRP